MNDATFLSLIVFLPTLAAVIIAFLPKGQTELIRLCTLGTTLVVAVLTLIMALSPSGDVRL